MDSKREDYSTDVEAFRTVLSKCLDVGPRDEFLVLYDESMLEFLDSLVSALQSISVSCTFLYLPDACKRFIMVDSQRSGSRYLVDLPASVVAAISASTAMLNLLGGSPETEPVRRAVNHTPRHNNCKLATIPGVCRAVLDAILAAPIDEILSASEDVAWILGESTEATVQSHDSLGNQYELTLALEGWENEPIMSPAVLLPGSWGNVPPGETFCCPTPSCVNGSICINGSVPGYVIREGEEVILHFADGKLIQWQQVAGPSSTVQFFERAKQRGLQTKDENWNTFAELGIGLNPKIVKLTGNPLLDEKAANTIHIAIGDNAGFGGDVSSLAHYDLLVLKPHLLINGHQVIKQGVIDRRLISALRTAASTKMEDFPLRDAIVNLREGRLGKHNGILMRRLSKAQRVNYVCLGSTEITEALRQLCDCLSTFGPTQVAAFIRSNPSFNSVSTSYLLNMLYHYRVLTILSTARDRLDKRVLP